MKIKRFSDLSMSGIKVAINGIISLFLVFSLVVPAFSQAVTEIEDVSVALVTPFPISSPNASPVPTFALNPVPSPTPAVSPVPTVTPTPILSPSPSVSPVPTVNPTPVLSPSPSVSPVPTVTPTPIPSPSLLPSPSATPVPTATVTPFPSSSPSATPVPTANPSPVPTPPANGGGGGGGGGGSGGGATGNGSVTTIIPTSTQTPVGRVLGAQAACVESGPYLTTYFKFGSQNDSAQVKKLQQFLNEYESEELSVTGFYGPLTRSAVNRFQIKNWEQILKPWTAYGLEDPKSPTGYVYKTTQRQINMTVCPELNLPMPKLP